ncbi:MAG: hypothetical protein CMN28_07525 [Salinisphaeraceae bacterium]|nr:hypothetical protein [Salinisphaeraceae bacterium]
MITSLLILIAILLAAGLAWRGARLATAGLLIGLPLAIAGYRLLPAASFWLLLMSAVTLLVPLSVRDVRRPWITRQRLTHFANALAQHDPGLRRSRPGLTFWWEQELAGGLPQWDRFAALPPPSPAADGPLNLAGPGDEHKGQPIAGLALSPRHGGAGLTHLELADWIFAAARADHPANANAAGITAAIALGPGPVLQRFGTQTQQTRYLPGLTRGDCSPALLLPDGSLNQPDDLICGRALLCRNEAAEQPGVSLHVSVQGRLVVSGQAERRLTLCFVKLLDPAGLGPEAGLKAGLHALLLETPADDPTRRDWSMEAPDVPLTQLVTGPGDAPAATAGISPLLDSALTLHQLLVALPQQVARQYETDPERGAAGVLAYRLAAHALDVGECPALLSRLVALITSRSGRSGETDDLFTVRLPAPGQPTAAQTGADDTLFTLIRLNTPLFDCLRAVDRADHHAALAAFDSASNTRWRRRVQLISRNLLLNVSGERLPVAQAATLSGPFTQRLAGLSARAGLVLDLGLMRFPREWPNGPFAAAFERMLAWQYLLSASLWRMPGDLPVRLDRDTLETVRAQAIAAFHADLGVAVDQLRPSGLRWTARLLLGPRYWRRRGGVSEGGPSR